MSKSETKTLALTPLEILYDADCGICQKCVAILTKLDRHHRLLFTASYTAGALERFGLTQQHADEQIWVLDSSGRRAGGARAVARVLDTLSGFVWIERVLRIRPAQWCADLAYRWVADHRYLFPGAQGSCKVARQA